MQESIFEDYYKEYSDKLTSHIMSKGFDHYTARSICNDSFLAFAKDYETKFNANLGTIWTFLRLKAKDAISAHRRKQKSRVLPLKTACKKFLEDAKDLKLDKRNKRIAAICDLYLQSLKPGEIATALGIDKSEVSKILTGVATTESWQFSQANENEKKQLKKISSGERIDWDVVDRLDLQDTIERVGKNTKEKECLKMYFYDGYTPSEIVYIMYITRSTLDRRIQEVRTIMNEFQ